MLLNTWRDACSIIVDHLIPRWQDIGFDRMSYFVYGLIPMNACFQVIISTTLYLLRILPICLHMCWTTLHSHNMWYIVSFLLLCRGHHGVPSLQVNVTSLVGHFTSCKILQSNISYPIPPIDYFLRSFFCTMAWSTSLLGLPTFVQACLPFVSASNHPFFEILI